jgi:hypothetical protein
LINWKGAKYISAAAKLRTLFIVDYVSYTVECHLTDTSDRKEDLKCDPTCRTLLLHRLEISNTQLIRKDRAPIVEESRIRMIGCRR